MSTDVTGSHSGEANRGTVNPAEPREGTIGVETTAPAFRTATTSSVSIPVKTFGRSSRTAWFQFVRFVIQSSRQRLLPNSP